MDSSSGLTNKPVCKDTAKRLGAGAREGTVDRSTVANKLAQYSCGPLRITSAADVDADAYDRHLVFDHVVLPENADQRERFEAVALSLRDLLAQRWLTTQQVHDRVNPK